MVMTESSWELKRAIGIRLIPGILIIGLLLFVPAGTFNYWQAWVYCGILFILISAAIIYFLKRDPALLRRRMEYSEQRGEQKKIVTFASLLILIGLLVPGLDLRFGWSTVPTSLVLLSDLMVFAGYLLTFLTFRENSFAARTIRVEEGQRVVSTGPYAIIRHPMYLGFLVLILFTPTALGSYWALVPFLPLPLFIALRILDEEKVLVDELPGYPEYCQRTRYRLVPGVW